MKPKVDLIYIDSGGGHRAAALALDEVIRGMELSWDLRLVSIQDLFAPIDVVRKVSGIPFQDLYNIMLRRGWTAGSAQMTPLAHLAIRVFHPSQLRVLSNYWAERRPDLVVSLIPHFNRAIKQSLESTLPQTRLVTILTDIADYPPHFWLERQDQFVICGCEHAQQQALSIGVPAEKVFCASGMILHPRFYEPIALDRPSERSRLGLDPNLPTALVLFGGEGSPEMIDVARELNRPGAGLQLILLCGRQDRVKQELSAQTRHVPMFIEGFTRQVPYFMELADFFIGKPGPGSISEAIVKRMPIVVRQDGRTLAPERYN